MALVALAGACDSDSTTPNRPPEAPIITQPTNGATFSPADAIQFQGSATDPEDGAITGVRLVWSSNLDGQLGTGGSFTRDDLSEGTHSITLTATDSEGESRNSSVSVTVVNLPPETPAIATPEDGSSFGIGDEVTFEGSATDPEDGSLLGASLVWTSSLDDEIGTGETFTRDDLSEGEHTITLTATDTHGSTNSASVTMTVANQPPSTPVITEPTDGSSVVAGTEVAFAGTASDPEDGPLTGGSLVWTSALDGEIGTGTSFTTSMLSAGEHAITLTATDSEGLTAEAAITFTVQGQPVATITAPEDDAVFVVGDEIRFQGSASDAEDGALTGASLVWTSDLDGEIGTGPDFQRGDLSEGTHTITLTATDTDGHVGTAEITLVVQVPGAPTVTITAPSDGTVFEVGAPVTFQGSANDPEDGPLTGGALVWTSDLDGEIGTGVSVSTSSLSAGAHTVTLTATDSHALTGQAQVSITVSTAPTATITAPTAGATFAAGATIDFAGSGNDAEDGALTGASLVWTSSRDGEIGTGTDVSSSSLSIGNHTVTLTATDSHGLTGTDQVSITVNPPGSPPTVSIDQPSDGGSEDVGESVTFVGSANDTEDGALTGGSLVWTSSRDGQIGTGETFATSSLSVGEHTITLTASDSDGWEVTDEITYTITSTASPIEVKVGSTAGSSIDVGNTTTLPIIVDMSSAAGRDVASIQVKVTWSTGVATYVSSSTAIGATINDTNAGTGEIVTNWFSGSGNDSTFTLFEVTLEGASAGTTTVSVEVEFIADELAADLSADTGTRNHSLTVN